MADPVPESTPGHHSAVVSETIPDNLDPVPLKNNGAPSMSPIMATITIDLDENDLNLYLEESTCLMEAISTCEDQCCSKNVNGDINVPFLKFNQWKQMTWEDKFSNLGPQSPFYRLQDHL